MSPLKLEQIHTNLLTARRSCKAHFATIRQQNQWKKVRFDEIYVIMQNKEVLGVSSIAQKCGHIWVTYAPLSLITLTKKDNNRN